MHLGLWEGLSHSASLRSIVIVFKSHSALLRLIVIILKVVAAKTNWREKIWKPSTCWHAKVNIVYLIHNTVRKTGEGNSCFFIY